MLTGKTITLEVEPYHVVATIKYKIEEVEGICYDQQRLLYRGTPLLDEYILSTYDIKNLSNLDLLVTMKAG